MFENSGGVALTHVQWNARNSNILAAVAEDDSNVLLFDKRKPNVIVETLCHDNKVTGIAWSPAEANLICSVGEGGRALIWDLNQKGGTADEKYLQGGRNEPALKSNTPVSGRLPQYNFLADL